jgi:hypothetical protein
MSAASIAWALLFVIEGMAVCEGGEEQGSVTVVLLLVGLRRRENSCAAVPAWGFRFGTAGAIGRSLRATSAGLWVDGFGEGERLRNQSFISFNRPLSGFLVLSDIDSGSRSEAKPWVELK